MTTKLNQLFRRFALALVLAVGAAVLAGCGTDGTVGDPEADPEGRQGLEVRHEHTSESDFIMKLSIRDGNGEDTAHELDLPRGENTVIELPVGEYSVHGVWFKDREGSWYRWSNPEAEWEYTVEPGLVTPFYVGADILIH